MVNSNLINCISPIDGEIIASRECLKENELNEKLSKAKIAQTSWAKVSFEKKANIIKKFLEIVKEKNSLIVPELARQMGRPIRYNGEIKPFEERINFLLEYGEKFLAEKVAPNPLNNFKRFTTREALGLVFVIAPWNYPFITANNSITTALLCGNSVFLKHASQTLLVGERFQEAFDEAGLPEGLFNNIYLSHEQTNKILNKGVMQYINFTGSVEVGREIERAVSGNFTLLGLELGGKDPAVVLEDCDFDDTVLNLVDGAFYNSGQSCCAVERIYVQENIFDKFIDAFVSETTKYKLGNPLHNETTLGPMANIRFANFVRKQIEEALTKKATTLINKKDFPNFNTDNDTSAYLAPQVLINVNHEMQIMTKESFGPVVGIMKFKKDEEAIKLVNDSEYGLTASIWSKDLIRSENLARNFQTGTVYLNRCDYVDPGLGWFGVKNTGGGISLGEHGFKQFTRPKNFHFKINK